MTDETPNEQPAVTPIHWNIHDTHPQLVEPVRAKLQEIVDPEIGLNIIQ